LQKTYGVGGLKPCSTEAEKEGRGGVWEEEKSLWPHDSLEMLPEEINVLHSLTVTPGCTARLHFTSPMFVCEIGTVVLHCIQVLEVTPGLLVNLRM